MSPCVCTQNISDVEMTVVFLLFFLKSAPKMFFLDLQSFFFSSAPIHRPFGRLLDVNLLSQIEVCLLQTDLDQGSQKQVQNSPNPLIVLRFQSTHCAALEL